MKKQNFLKIISDEAIHFAKMLVPEDFAREHFNSVSISANVILMVPGGRKWEIELSKSNGQMSLQNGWEKFAQDLSLKLGYSVVFRYDGGCRFHVSVFDGSHEIEYPSNCKKRGRGRPSLPESQPCKARKSHLTDEPVKNLTSEPKSPDVKRRRKIKKAVENGENYTPSSSPFKSPSTYEPVKNLTSKRQSPDVKRGGKIKKAVENGENYTPSSSSPFKSGYPHFKVEIPPEGTKELNIPDWFAREHLSRFGNVKLEVSNGRTWTVVLLFSQPPNKPPVAKFLGLTWKTFAKDNNLKEGDICHFELVQTDLFKVVLESTSGSKSCPEAPSSLETNKSVKESRSFTNEMRSTVHKYMYIPTWFANEHLIGRNQVKLRVSSGRTWIVSLGFTQPASNSRPVARLFGDSWKEFVLDNNLYVGRVCVFELIKGKGEEPLLDVSFPTSSVSHHSATTSGKKIPPERRNSHDTNQPCEGSFTKIIPPSGIRGGLIRLPTNFTNKHLAMLMEDTNVRLVVEGQFWDIKLLIRLQPHRYGILHGGWFKFVKDNGLKSGDECVFNLIRVSDVVVMKVFIKRR